MPRRAKRKGSLTASSQQRDQPQPQAQAQSQAQPQAQPQPQAQSQPRARPQPQAQPQPQARPQPHKHMHQHLHKQQQQQQQQQQHQQQRQQQRQQQPQQQRQQQRQQQQQQQRQQQDVECAFKRMSINAPPRSFLHGSARQGGGLEPPCMKPNRSAKSIAKGSCNPAMSKTSQFQQSRKLQDASREKLGKTVKTFDGWVLQRSKVSNTKVRTEPPKPTVSPLTRNRFYELRDKTPVREKPKQLKKKPNGTGNAAKNAVTTNNPSGNLQPSKRQCMEFWWNPLETGDMQTTKPSTPGANTTMASGRKSTSLFGTYLNVDGTRSRISNWRENNNPRPFFEMESMHFAEPPPCRPENHLKTIMEDAPLRCRRPILNNSEKIAPLQNLAAPVRDLWVTKPEHASYSQLRCVKILPPHHQCAGPERNLTPNDVDTKNLASKLEKHRRLPKPGSNTAQCICFRNTRRAFCTVCKATIIGRAFRKCRMHPEVGFLTDHFYCPFCRAEPSALKDI